MSKTKNIHKILLMTGIVSIFFTSLPIILALTCTIESGSCSSGTCVFSMNQSSNSHAGDCSYDNLKVCCEEPGVTLTTNIRPCNAGEGRVLSLYQLSNSHAERYQFSSYSNHVCLTPGSGTITCSYSSSCNPGEGLASLNQNTNSHVGDYSAYSTKICCSYTAPPPVCSGQPCGEIVQDAGTWGVCDGAGNFVACCDQVTPCQDDCPDDITPPGCVDLEVDCFASNVTPGPLNNLNFTQCGAGLFCSGGLSGGSCSVVDADIISQTYDDIDDATDDIVSKADTLKTTLRVQNSGSISTYFLVGCAWQSSSGSPYDCGVVAYQWTSQLNSLSTQDIVYDLNLLTDVPNTEIGETFDPWYHNVYTDFYDVGGWRVYGSWPATPTIQIVECEDNDDCESLHAVGWTCNATNACEVPPVCIVNTNCDYPTENYTNCPQDCCKSDCSGCSGIGLPGNCPSDNTCHIGCNETNGCLLIAGCNNLLKDDKICSGDSESNITCCEQITDCGLETGCGSFTICDDDNTRNGTLTDWWCSGGACLSGILECQVDCPLPQCCLTGNCENEDYCDGDKICSNSQWIDHCGDGKVTPGCGENCDIGLDGIPGSPDDVDVACDNQCQLDCTCPGGCTAHSDCPEHWQMCDVDGSINGTANACYDLRPFTGGCDYYDYCAAGPCVWYDDCYVTDGDTDLDYRNLILDNCTDSFVLAHGFKTCPYNT